MRNGRKNKIREYRKSIRGAKGVISLYKLYDRLFPEESVRFWDSEWRLRYDVRVNARNEWFRKISHSSLCEQFGENAPAHFRRGLTRQYRTKEKQALRNALARGEDLADFSFQPMKRNANWLWW